MTIGDVAQSEKRMRHRDAGFFTQCMMRLVLMTLLATVGCHSEPETMEKIASKISVGMTPSEVEKLLGPSTELPYEELSDSYRQILENPPQGLAPAKGDDVVYRQWIDKAKNANTVGFVAFRNGKVVDGTVYVETTFIPK